MSNPMSLSLESSVAARETRDSWLSNSKSVGWAEQEPGCRMKSL